MILSLALIPVLLLGAVVLLKVALWPRRTGSDPHCAACNYLLIGNVSGRCPECGRDLALPNSTLLGQRQRRPGLAVVAILMLLLGILPLIGMALALTQRIEWDHYRPASWLVQDLTPSSTPQASRAWNELDRRRKTVGLSPAIQQKLIALALNNQAQPVQGPLGSQFIDFLGDMSLANRLSNEQTNLFFTQAMSLQLAVRPTVIIGDDAPYVVAHTGRGPSKGWWYRVQPIQAKLDDKIIRTGGSQTSSGSGSGSTGSYIKITTPGKHTFESTIRIEFFNGPFDNEKASKLCCTRSVILKADFAAIEKAPADYVKLIDDPTLKAQIETAITVPQFARYPSGDCHLMIDVKNAPANVAFDVFARADGKEYLVGSIALAKGRQCGFGFDTESLKSVTANKFDLILRTSEAAARRTTDLFDIWTGQVIIKDVLVKPRPN